MNRDSDMTGGEPPIPDFCSARAVALLAFQLQLVAIVLTLANYSSLIDAFARLIVLSLYLQWLGLCGAAVLCLARRRLLQWARPEVVLAACWLLLMVVTLLLSDIAYAVATRILHESLAPSESRREFVLRHLSISAIVSGVLLHYFWTRARWRAQIRAEGEARYQALQARIRPHFLFNALNSLAALIATKPRAAEDMVEDMADLFRVSLRAGARLVPLREELELVRAYMRIEQTRLGARLGMEWEIPEALMDIEIPQLSIQPLVENAVYHGAAKLTGTATIVLRVLDQGRELVVEVENPLPPAGSPDEHGARHAVANIAERLRLIYGDRARLEMQQADGVFVARLRMPKVRGPAEGAQ